jgi:hypothetical protein
VETDRVAGLKEPVLTVFSHEFLEHPGPLFEKLKVDFADMLCFVAQQIGQFRSTQPDFEVHHMAERMYQTLEEMETEILGRMSVEKRLSGIPAKELLQGIPTQERLQGIPAQERLQGIPAQERLQGIPAQERLQGIPAQERLQGIPAQERLQGLSAEEKKRLRKMLDEEILSG